MTHVVCEPCFGCKYTDCVVVRPVECFYEGEKILYIHPDECIDCEACVPECPVEAISYVAPDDGDDDLREAHEFFETVLPGRSEPIGSPRGARNIGKINSDHPRVLALINGEQE